MKKELKNYVAPALQEFEIELERGIAQSIGGSTGNGLGEFKPNNDYANDDSFWN